MRRLAILLVISALAIFPLTAAAQVPEPYYKPGETPLVLETAGIVPAKGDIAEYGFRLDLVGEDAVESVSARAVVAVLDRAPTGETVLGAAIQVVSSSGFPSEVAASLQGASLQVLLLLDAKNELVGAMPENGLESVFMMWFDDYAFLWQFLKFMPTIESGVPIRLKDGALSVGESRDAEGRRYIQISVQDPRISRSLLPMPYAPVTELTLIPSWSMIRSLKLVGSKSLETEMGPRIPVYTLVLKGVRLAPR